MKNKIIGKFNLTHNGKKVKGKFLIKRNELFFKITHPKTTFSSSETAELYKVLNNQIKLK